MRSAALRRMRVLLVLFALFAVSLALFAPSTMTTTATLLTRRAHHRHAKVPTIVTDDPAAAAAALAPPAVPSKVHPEDDAVSTADCLLRNFVLTSAGIIEPSGFATSWTETARSALQIDVMCPDTTPVQPSQALLDKLERDHPRPLAAPHSIDEQASCDTSFYVSVTGSDSASGSIDAPFATLTHALAATRSARATSMLTSPCIYLRAGTYYLGEAPPATAGSSKDSQFGVIDLQPEDSGLTIAAYPGETVVLSAGARITPSWQVVAKTAAGTIYSTKLTPTNPSTMLLTDAFHLNEMFVDGARSVRAKWPNGDPSTHGLFSSNTGYDTSAMAWLPPFPHDASVEVHTSGPSVYDDYFPDYQMGFGGASVVYEPQRSFWATANPPGGGGVTFVVPSGMNVTSTDLSARAANWSNPSTGYAHVFHGGAWANWIFSLDSYDASSQLLHFSEGGFQDARGWQTGGAFYVEWLIEELDDPMEWFYDQSAGVLYFMPNNTAPPSEFVVSQLPCLVSAHGSAEVPVADVLISGITFSHTSNTMMRKFEVPSGGDWSLHRGGAMFLTGTADAVVQQSTFSYLGGTGIVVSNWNLATEITGNEFVWGCDSGVVVLGTSGFDGVTYTDQPTLVRVHSNLFHELGIYIKQSAPVLVSVSRSATIADNLIFNVPRAGINVNDPFYGNHTLSGNIIFNTVRETADHGPINTWDRLPFLTEHVNATTGEPYASIDPEVSHITRNLLFNAYRSAWPIDHDDGSRRYDDSQNVLVYGGYKNYLGNSKAAHNMMYIYPDFPRLTLRAVSPWLASVDAQRIERKTLAAQAARDVGAPLAWGVFCLASYSPIANVAGWNEKWYNNTCALWSSSQPYELDNCQIGNLAGMIPYLANNRLYFPAGVAAQIPCSLANGTSVTLTLSDMQALGYEVGSTQATLPTTEQLITQGFETLFG